MRFKNINTRTNAGGEIGGAAAGVNQVPPQAPASGMEMLDKPTRLTDGDVRKTLVQMAQAITLQAQAMTALAEKQGVPRENPPTSTMANRLSVFTRVNPPIYTRSKIAKDLEEECRETMLHDSMDLSKLMFHVKQVDESRKRKHTRVGNKSRQVEKNFSRKSSTEIMGIPRFKKGLSHQGESSSFKGLYDRDSKPRVERKK